jgi:hypothetical protein
LTFIIEPAGLIDMVHVTTGLFESSSMMDSVQSKWTSPGSVEQRRECALYGRLAAIDLSLRIMEDGIFGKALHELVDARSAMPFMRVLSPIHSCTTNAAQPHFNSPLKPRHGTWP